MHPALLAPEGDWTLAGAAMTGTSEHPTADTANSAFHCRAHPTPSLRAQGRRILVLLAGLPRATNRPSRARVRAAIHRWVPQSPFSGGRPNAREHTCRVRGGAATSPCHYGFAATWAGASQTPPHGDPAEARVLPGLRPCWRGPPWSEYRLEDS